MVEVLSVARNVLGLENARFTVGIVGGVLSANLLALMQANSSIVVQHMVEAGFVWVVILSLLIKQEPCVKLVLQLPMSEQEPVKPAWQLRLTIGLETT